MKKDTIWSSILIYLLTAILLLATGIALKMFFIKFIDTVGNTSSECREVRKIIIDAGHGGFDGGAVSITGTPEKDLNLDISLTLREILFSLGYRTVMTRITDTELTAGIDGTRKMNDLRGRLNIADDNPEAVFISIHMNKFPQSKYKGLQVYYSPNTETGKILAQSIKETVKNKLQHDNNREIKAATSAIFILHKIKQPAVLVECGFISNSEEAQSLENSEYRASLSSAIALGFTSCSKDIYNNQEKG